jgi:hypothetical protein
MGQSRANPSLRKFPANREKNREFSKFEALGYLLSGKITVKSKAYSEIPYYAEQGIFSAVTGKEIRLNSEFLPKNAKPIRLLSIRHPPFDFGDPNRGSCPLRWCIAAAAAQLWTLSAHPLLRR